MAPIIIGVGAVVVLLIMIVIIRNGLINKKNQVENAFGSIDAMLKKRYDLIPNLVETVKTYMSHEADVLTKITELRNKAASPELSDEDKVRLNNEINAVSRRIMVAVENYPELKASEPFLQLQRSWNEVEEQISASRRFYNAAVTEYNNGIEQFPGSLFASGMSMTRKRVLEIPEEERENISAKNLF